MEPKYEFIVFPYLRTQRRVQIGGIELRSSRDLNDLPEEVQRHLRVICSLFFLEDGVRIDEMVCGYTAYQTDENERQRAITPFWNAALFIAYLYCHSTEMVQISLSAEHVTACFFTTTDVVIPVLCGIEGYGDRVKALRERAGLAGKRIPQYICWRNGQNGVMIDDNSTISPQLHGMLLHGSQDISKDVEEFFSHTSNWSIREFLHFPGDRRLGEVGKRVFIALEWYRRSCRATISREEAIVCLATALEALLQLPAEKDLRNCARISCPFDGVISADESHSSIRHETAVF